MASNVKKLTFKPANTNGLIVSSWTGAVSSVSGPTFATEPTTGTMGKKVSISIPSNAKIKSVSIGCDVANPTKWKISKSCGTITPKTKSVTLTVTAKWVGSAKSAGPQSETAHISNLSITVSYTVTTSGSPANNNNNNSDSTDGTTNTDESVSDTHHTIDECDDLIIVYDPKKKKTYRFDGVVKVGYSFALTIDDEGEKSGEADYSNGAKKNPIEITAEVAMSDCNHGTSYLTGDSIKRAKTAINRLHSLQTSRRSLEVITYYKTYKKMLIKSISVSQDETNSVGWTASIVFHEKMEKPKVHTDNVDNTTEDNDHTPAVIGLTGCQ